MTETRADIVHEAAERMEQAINWESTARARFRDDLRFGHADAYNGYQWPADIARARALGRKPMLTINKARQHCLQIINDAKQNKVAVKITPTGDNATYEAAEALEGVIRHIEYQSQAESAYDTATEFQVFGGIGYWRIVTDYIHDDTMDQEIFIRRIPDPLSVYLDPGINEVDGSDARWGIIFTDIPKDVFFQEYPNMRGKFTTQPLGVHDAGFDTKNFVRIAEYYRRTEKKDKLFALPSGETIRGSKLGPLKAELRDDPNVQTRDIITHNIEYFKIAGTEVIERTDWPGRYIPIVRVIGEETIIDGQMDRKGHVRALVDPQRMYNYWTSSAVEHVALQSKTPYIGPMEAFSGLETFWDAANREDLAWLPYRGYDSQGRPLNAPERQAPPTMAQAYITGMEVAGNEMQMVSGQYQAEMGQESNERSGLAIQQRQRQGDNATYHYIDHLASAIRYTGRILLDLIPHIYDTARVIKIMAEDGTVSDVHVDPTAPDAHAQVQDPRMRAVKTILNPSIGRYDVQADVGPAFGTRRQEAFNALVQLIGQAPSLMPVAGDLLMKAADFPMADEMAERLRNMVPPQALGGPSPEMMQAQQMIQSMQAKMAAMLQDMATQKMERQTEQDQKLIDVYKAQTDRLAIADKVDPTALVPVLRQLVHEALSTHLLNQQVQQGNPSQVASALPPVTGLGEPLQ